MFLTFFPVFHKPSDLGIWYFHYSLFAILLLQCLFSLSLLFWKLQYATCYICYRYFCLISIAGLSFNGSILRKKIKNRIRTIIRSWTRSGNRSGTKKTDLDPDLTKKIRIQFQQERLNLGFPAKLVSFRISRNTKRNKFCVSQNKLVVSRNFVLKRN
jgi:hypothetical protein